MALHISLAAEPVAHIANFAITNALLTTWILMAVIAVTLAAGTRNLQLVPRGAFQNILEMLVDGLYGLTQSVAGHKAPRFFTIVFSFFLFIVLSNWSGLLPGVGTIGLEEPAAESSHAESNTQAPGTTQQEVFPAIVEDGQNVETASAQDTHAPADAPDAPIAPELHLDNTAVTEPSPSTDHAEPTAEHGPTFIPLLRAPTADLNFTIALALISVITIHTVGFRSLGFAGHLSKYFDFSSPINFYVGILELIGEFSKIISFAFRLFGNIFAGEVLLVVIASLIPFIAPLPFLFLEIFVGFIQGLVFAILTLVFLTMASTSHHAEEH